MGLAMSFACEHPAVTSAIIGPRTMEHLEGLLNVADVELSPAHLDAIDAIVPAGTNLSREDDGYIPPALVDASLRRRSRREEATPVVISGRTDKLREMFGGDD